MFETILGWLTFLALIALPLTHPVRAKSYGPRLIVFLVCVGTTGFGLYILSKIVRLYLLGIAPILNADGVAISAHPTFAYLLIAIQALLGIASLTVGIYFGKLGFRRGKHATVNE